MLIKKIVDYQTKYGPRHLVDMISDKEFIEKMKSSISWPDRSYDSAKNQWSFSDKGLTMLKCMPGVALYEEALSEYVDASQYDLPEPYKGIDVTINFEKFRRSATEFDPELYPYNFQKEGISRLVNMPAQGLYYECGLGKTYTAICAAKELMDRGIVKQCLIVSMVQMAINSWIDTLNRMGYSYTVISGPMKYRPSQFYLANTDFVITLCTTCDSSDKFPLYESFETLGSAGKKSNIIPRKKKSFIDIALMKEDLMLVADELHKLSDTQSSRFKNLFKIRKHCVRASGLTGTVLKSTPEKCLLPLRFEYPDIFRSKYEFENTFTVREQGRFGFEVVGYRNIDVLKNVLHRAGMPALKKDHLKDLPELLPPKVVYCETDKVSLELVDTIRNDPNLLKLGKGEDYAELSDLYIRTHQALVCPSTFDPSFKATNRLEAVADCLESLEGKTVIFTTLKKAILELHAYLTSKGIGCTCCSGLQSKEEIDRRVDKFVADPNCTVMIATVQKMGTGFDGIKIAQNAIVYDLNTNAADLIQALGRLHRNGQKNAVSQIYILQDNVISEYQYKKVMEQKKLTEEVEDASFKGMESTVDLREILALVKDSKNFLRTSKKR